MSDIAEIIRRFRSGQIEQPEVIAELVTLLKNGHVESDEVIEAVSDAHKSEPLPAELHDAIIDRIASHLTGQFWTDEGNDEGKDEVSDAVPVEAETIEGSPGSDRVADRLAAEVEPHTDDGDQSDEYSETLSNLAENQAIAAPRAVLPSWLIGVGAVVAVLVVVVLTLQPGLFRREAPELPATEPLRTGDTIQDCRSCPPLIVVPAGPVGDPFAVGIYEVTVSEFAAFVEDTGLSFSGCNTYDGDWSFYPELSWRDPGFRQSGRHPVTCVSWFDAQQYLEWISAKTNQAYRLLSAAEWEYVASPAAAGDARGDLCALANIADMTAAKRYPGWSVSECTDNFVTTAPGGSYDPNAFGLHDVWGNVYEWIDDCWSPDNEPPASFGECSSRELKGGSWFSRPEYVRAGSRNHFAPDYRSSSFGFRIARAINR